QTAVSHLKSRVGAGAKKIFASAAPQNQKVAQKNIKSLIKRKDVMNFPRENEFLKKFSVSLSQREIISALFFTKEN
ncbi:MAG: hypothetical protein LBC07_03800, partial [Elusimicrobiota bacterium]|nr:hypothetical protein [Elusimicrobiota bacterium]